jgi:chromosome segregation ATPase
MKKVSTTLTGTDTENYDVHASHKDNNTIIVVATRKSDEVTFREETRGDSHQFAFVKRAFSDADPGECNCSLEPSNNILTLKIEFPKFEIQYQFTLHEDVRSKLARELKLHSDDMQFVKDELEMFKKTTTSSFDTQTDTIQSLQRNISQHNASIQHQEELINRTKLELVNNIQELVNKLVTESEQRQRTEHSLLELQSELEHQKSELEAQSTKSEQQTTQISSDIGKVQMQMEQLNKKLDNHDETDQFMSELESLRNYLNETRSTFVKQIQSISDSVQEMAEQMDTMKNNVNKVEFPDEILNQQRIEIESLRSELEQQKQVSISAREEANQYKSEILGMVKSYVNDVNQCKMVMEQQRSLLAAKDEESTRNNQELEALRLELGQLRKVTMHSEQQLRSFVNHQTEITQQRFDQHDSRLKRLRTDLRQVQESHQTETKQGLLKGMSFKNLPSFGL